MSVPEPISPEQAELLRQLEEKLWRAETRFSRDFLESVLADDFMEYGASGKRYTRRETIETEGQPLDVEIPLPDFQVRPVCPSAALVLYRSIQHLADGTTRQARRTSLWIHDGTGWKLSFHQGTLIPFVKQPA